MLAGMGGLRDGSWEGPGGLTLVDVLGGYDCVPMMRERKAMELECIALSGIKGRWRAQACGKCVCICVVTP